MKKKSTIQKVTGRLFPRSILEETQRWNDPLRAMFLLFSKEELEFLVDRIVSEWLLISKA